MSSFFAALHFLTVFPWPRHREHTADEIAQSVIFFPVIGLLLGLLLALVDCLMTPLARPALSSVTIVAVLALLTRGLHLDGLGDTFDGLGAGGDRERMLRIMDDSHTGAFGLIAIVLVLFFKIHAIESIEGERWRALLVAPVLGRWSMALLGYRSHAAKAGLGAMLVERLASKHVLYATFITVILAAAVMRSTGVALMALVALLTLAAKNYLHRRLGGLTGDTFGAIGELSETSTWVLVALGPQ